MALLTRALGADGEVVWSWLPDAGVKFLRSQLLRDDGDKQSPVTGESTKEPVKPLCGECRVIPV